MGCFVTEISVSGSHCVHFYEPTRFPSKHIADFIRKGIEQSEAVVLVTTEDHLDELESAVAASGVDVRNLRSSGRWSFISLNILLRALRSGVSVEVLLTNAINPTVQTARAKSLSGRVRIYGEFADAMLKLGRPDLCLELERYGTRMASEDVADIYCGYSADAFPDAGFAIQFTRVCLSHDLIHTNIPDHADWRYKMALGISQARNDFV